MSSKEFICAHCDTPNPTVIQFTDDDWCVWTVPYLLENIEAIRTIVNRHFTSPVNELGDKAHYMLIKELQEVL